MARAYPALVPVSSGVPDSLTLCRFGVKARRPTGVFAVCEEFFEIELFEAGLYAPGLVVVPLKLKTKTTKTTR